MHMCTQVHYLAGWSESRARDNLINDSFSAFAVTLKAGPTEASDGFRTDKKEIFEAHWFVWKDLMSAWDAKGKPNTKKVLGLELGMRKGDPAIKAANPKSDDGERNVMMGNVLKWLDTYRTGKGHVVKTKVAQQGEEQSMKVSWGIAG